MPVDGSRIDEVTTKLFGSRERAFVQESGGRVRCWYDQELREARRTSIFRASHIFLPIATGASATDVAALRARAATIRSGLDADNFEDAIEQYGGGNLGSGHEARIPVRSRDEADAVLIDEGVVPLIIARARRERARKHGVTQHIIGRAAVQAPDERLHRHGFARETL